MCGAWEWALSASRLSHFSTTTKVSGPNGLPAAKPSASITGPYSMQPFSACTAGMLARKWPRMVSRMPGLVVMMASTWIMVVSPLGSKSRTLCSRGARPAHQPAGTRTLQDAVTVGDDTRHHGRVVTARGLAQAAGTAGQVVDRRWRGAGEA